jgi:hypothetical protein
MGSLFRENRSLAAFTWVLIGVFVASSMGFLPASKTCLVFAEVDVLEVESDDKDGATEFDFAFVTPISHYGSNESWQILLVRVSAQFSRPVRETHLVRGPPRC